MKVVVRVNEHSVLHDALRGLPARARAERLRELALLGLYRAERAAATSPDADSLPNSAGADPATGEPLPADGESASADDGADTSANDDFVDKIEF